MESGVDQSLFRCILQSENKLLVLVAFYRRSLFLRPFGTHIHAYHSISRSSAEGLGYVISFAIGATVVLILMWTLRFGYHVAREQSLVDAYDQLPGFHFQVMWLPGGLAGLLWSIGNIASMLSVVNLGEGVGYSIVQAQMLVAGLWGILYYREARGTRTIAAWFSCACITVAGILFLSHEHVKS